MTAASRVPRIRVYETFIFVMFTLVSAGFGHLVVYRALLPGGVPPDPHDPLLNDSMIPVLASSLLVALVVGFRCGAFETTVKTLTASLFGAIIILAYLFVFDWLGRGWGEEVGHDIFLGSAEYFTIAGFQLLLTFVALFLVATARRLVRRLRSPPSSPGPIGVRLRPGQR